ncbi:MAG: hypothetical protein KDJ29_03340 [Hyphomicrobiales bacterium]|nr:hypothetical protein [Hyphomicrobiales bacterium]
MAARRRKNVCEQGAALPGKIIAMQTTIDVACRAVPGRAKAGGHFSRCIEEVTALIGRSPYPGTLNCITDHPVLLDRDKALRFDSGTRFLWPATLNGSAVWVYRTRAMPGHVLEIVSDKKLRDRLDPDCLDRLSLKIAAELVEPTGFLYKAAWRLIWQGREQRYYTDDRYHKKTKRFFRYLS